MENKSLFGYFKSASDKFVIEGPGLATGDIRVEIQEQAIIICSCLERAFKAGKKAKAEEIKRALDDKT